MATAKNQKTEIMGAKFSRSQEKLLLDMFVGGTFGASLPLAATGLLPGQMWNNAGVVTVVAQP